MPKHTTQDTKLDLIVSKIEGLDNKINRTIDEVVDLKQDMAIVKNYLTNEVMTKADGREIMSTIDAVITNQKKFDQELTLLTHRSKELTTITEKHTKEIKELQAIANY